MQTKLFYRICFRLIVIAALALPLNITIPSAKASSGSLVVAISQDVQGQDPSKYTDTHTNLIAGQIFDTLNTLPHGSKTPQPGLAQSWIVSTDKLTWTFTLRSGITFHNGETFDGSSVVFNFKRWWDPADAHHDADFPYFYSYFGYKGEANTLLEDVYSPSANQVVFQLTRPEPLLPLFLALPSLSIASPQAITNGTLDSHPVGTGPFKFVEWTPGDHTLVQANLGYWGKVPYMNELQFKVIPTDSDRIGAIESNTVQVAYDLPGYDYTTANQNLNLTAFSGYGLNIGYLGINRGHTPLNNQKVREAIAHAINKTKLLQTYYDPMDQVAAQFLPPGLLGYKDSLVDYDYNPTLAKSLLTQAGYTNGFTTTLTYRNVARIYLRQPGPTAQAIQADLAAVGIRVNVQAMESSAFLDLVWSGNADLFLLGWGADYPHPSNFFTILCDGTYPVAYGPRDTTLCNTVSTANAATDPANQETLYQSASQTVRDTLPIVPLSNGRTTTILRSEVSGLQPSFLVEDYETVFLTNGLNQPVPPDSPTTLQTHGDEAPATTIYVPANSVSDPITLAYSLSDSPTPPPGGQASLGDPFALTAYRDGAPLVQQIFAQPVEVTFDYHTYAGYLFDPASLDVYINNSGSWVKANTTCSSTPASVLDTQKHTFTAYTCQTGQFALFGNKDRVPVFLAITRK
jgi:peptide/nickel transport system substrate-binding protein